MGIIKAVNQAIGGAFADQWLEVYEADNMGDQTVFSRGVKIRQGENRKGTEDTVTNKTCKIFCEALSEINSIIFTTYKVRIKKSTFFSHIIHLFHQVICLLTF